MTTDPLSDATRILGERVRKHREALGVSQEKFAEIARVHWTFVSQVERGIRNISLHNLLKLAAGFGIDAGELVTGLKPPEKPPGKKT